VTKTDSNKLGRRLFKVIGTPKEVLETISSVVASLEPESIKQTTKPAAVEWNEKRRLFFWGGNTWRCTLKETRQVELSVYLVGFRKASPAAIEDSLKYLKINTKIKAALISNGLHVIEESKKVRKRPYKKPRGLVFNPITREMVRRTPLSRLRATADWEARERMRAREIQLRKDLLKRNSEARRSKRLEMYEAACREKERIWREHGITEEFGRSKQWQSTRKVVIKEWQGICAVCLNKIEGLIHIHHIHPKGKFPEKALEVENLVPVHSQCHAKIHSSKPVKIFPREAALKRHKKDRT